MKLTRLLQLMKTRNYMLEKRPKRRIPTKKLLEQDMIYLTKVPSPKDNPLEERYSTYYTSRDEIFSGDEDDLDYQGYNTFK